MEGTKRNVKLILNLILPIIAVVGFFYFGAKLVVLFMPFFVGWVISLIANPLVRFLESKLKIVRKAGSAIVIVLVLGLVFFLCYSLVVVAVREIGQFMNDVPAMVESAKGEYSTISSNLGRFLDKLPEDTKETVYELTGNFHLYISDALAGVDTNGIMDKASNIASNVPNVLAGIIFGLLASYFFIAQKEVLDSFVRAHTPKVLKNRLHRLKTELFDVIIGYFKAQLKIMVIEYVIICIGLGLLKVPYFLVWSFFIALLDMLPVFGTGTVLWPWMALEILTGDFGMLIGLAILYIVTQLTHQLIQPKMIGDSIGLNPFATLFFMYVGYLVWGVIGMVVAIPTGMILIHLYKTGAFDTMIYSAKELTKEVIRFLHMDIPADKEK